MNNFSPTTATGIALVVIAIALNALEAAVPDIVVIATGAVGIYLVLRQFLPRKKE